MAIRLTSPTVIPIQADKATDLPPVVESSALEQDLLKENKVTVLYFIAVLVVAMLACSQTFTAATTPVALPAVSVQITRDYCPSVEVQSGMQIAWVNQGSVDRILIIERTDTAGNVLNTGGTTMLQAGDAFAVALNDPGEYTYYCSKDYSASGTITVLQ
jgi:plastocyanin